MDESARTGASRPGGGRRLMWRAALALAVFAAAYLAYAGFQDYRLGRELVMTNPDSIPSRPDLVAYANPIGKAAFQANCVSCHGADLRGSRQTGVPNLTDNIWLYDYGRVSDIERTVMYGIRSGLGKSHNVTDMPAIGLQKALSPDEIKDVIAFVLSLHKQKEDPAAVERGSNLFQDKGVCYDCHSRDATGIPDYGAPNLVDDDWLWGGDEATLYKSIYNGRHGRCPAWSGKLSSKTIRAVAVYLHSMSKESPESPTNRTADAVRKDASHG